MAGLQKRFSFYLKTTTGGCTRYSRYYRRQRDTVHALLLYFTNREIKGEKLFWYYAAFSE